jgi:hypothetical protein
MASTSILVRQKKRPRHLFRHPSERGASVRGAAHPAYGRQGTGDLEAALVAACAGVVATEHAVRLSGGREGCRRGGCGR